MKNRIFSDGKRAAMAMAGAIGLAGAGFLGTAEASAVTINSADINPAYQQYLNDVAAGKGSEWVIIPSKYKTYTNTGRGDGAALPASYSLINSGFGTEVKNQGMDGDCWAFAMTTAIESNLKKTKNIDVEFSPKQMDYLLGPGSPYYQFASSELGVSREIGGGSNFYVASYMLGGQYTPIQEAQFFAKMKSNDAGLAKYSSWEDYTNTQSAISLANSVRKQLGQEQIALDSYMKSMNIASVMEGSDFIVTKYHGYGGDEDSEGRIKKDVYENGAVWVGTYAPYTDNCYDEDTQTIIDRGSTVCGRENGHAMAIVGWDDAHTYTDPRDGSTKTGAFLLQNSWGDSDWLQNYGYDRFITEGRIDTAGLNEEVLRRIINEYEEDAFVWLAYDYADSTINFASIETVETNVNDKIYDVAKMATGLGADDEGVEFAYNTSAGATAYIESIGFASHIPFFSEDVTAEIYFEHNGESEKIGEVAIRAGEYGQDVIELDEEIEASGLFKVKAIFKDNAGQTIDGVIESGAAHSISEYAPYFSATVYTNGETEIEVPNTSVPDSTDGESTTSTTPNTGVFTGNEMNAKVAGAAVLVGILTMGGVALKMMKNRKHLFHKVGFNKR